MQQYNLNIMKENKGLLAKGEEVRIEEKRVGDKFLPFEDLFNFSGIKLTEKGGQIMHVGNGFNFKGVPVSITIMTEDYSMGLESVVTPLGRAREVISFENDEIKAEEHPLILGVHTYIRSIKTDRNLQKYRNLQEYALEFDLGGKNYYLRLGGEDDPNTMGRAIQDGHDVEPFDCSLKDIDGNAMNVLLPFNPDLLRNITAKIVKKDLPRQKT